MKAVKVTLVIIIGIAALIFGVKGVKCINHNEPKNFGVNVREITENVLSENFLTEVILYEDVTTGWGD